MYTQAEFLELAHKYLGAPEQTKGIEEVNNILEVLNQPVSSEVPDEPEPQAMEPDYPSKSIAKTEALFDDEKGYREEESTVESPEESRDNQSPEIDGEEK